MNAGVPAAGSGPGGGGGSAPGFWRSQDELSRTDEFRAHLEREFHDLPGSHDGLSRRRFLQLMGASLALGAVQGCFWEEEKLVPFAEQSPDGPRAPGLPRRFATAYEIGDVARAVLATSYEGRPIKLEGNALEPETGGATDVFAQAAVLELYDPDRSRAVCRFEGGRAVDESWEAFEEYARPLLERLAASGGAGLAVLAEASSSPTRARLARRLAARFPKLRWHEYEAVSRDRELEGAALAFGRACRTHVSLEGCRVIADLDADLLGSHPLALKNARAFAAGRRPETGHMSRLYAFESRHSITGASSDHRLPLRREQIAPLLAALEARLAARAKGEPAPEAKKGTFLATARVARHLAALEKDLLAARGASLVAVGPAQPPSAHAAAHRVNALLGNVGRTVRYTLDPRAGSPSHAASIDALAKAIFTGEVTSLFLLGGNPVLGAPADSGFALALAKLEHTIHLSLYRDETSRACRWHLPRAHFLEAWHDARAYDGTLLVAQPIVLPLHGGRSPLELVALLADEKERDGRELVRASFGELAGDGSEGAFRKALHDGFVLATRFPDDSPALRPAAAAPAPEEEASPRALSADEPRNGALELAFFPDPRIHDGRFANNGWLQELPEFMTKLTWDNAALFAPATAAALGVRHETLVRLEIAGRSLEVAAYVMPGQAPGSVALFLGSGRTAAGGVGGDVAQGVPPVGFDAYRLRTKDGAHFAAGLTVTPTGKPYRLAVTQNHHAIDEVGLKAREARLGALVREAPLAHYLEHRDFAKHAVHAPPALPLFDELRFDEGHRWGMAIDLGACTGCNACVVSCQSENNIPIVGKDQVLRGREMHWLRIDRYFAGPADDPRVATQPVMCQHCENAPCEQVCPVGATMHSKEGLNDMVYNRCVGTRYCANNCPYKVRRFNYLDYWKRLDGPESEVLKLVFNPEVTVRSRGVMEKCTFCTQRIQSAKIHAKNEGRPLRDGEVVPACAQVCPTDAIVFGDLNDRQSAVARRAASERAYGLLAELNVKPRVSYLARVRNPHPDLAGEATSGAEGEHGRERHG